MNYTPATAGYEGPTRDPRLFHNSQQQLPPQQIQHQHVSVPPHQQQWGYGQPNPAVAGNHLNGGGAGPMDYGM